ncbi:MAG: phosphoenolpyruvate--protein phosphotransferase [Spirochaetales bacterium]|jgi:phosphotransferase system enzyme I (PtsI)|nr:phosphoenolpyruvate--protein phosphotransferase [Spirochaetales bacterium]
MRIIKGIQASSGIVIGKVFLYATQSFKAPRYPIEQTDVPNERKRFQEALNRAHGDLVSLKDATENSNQDNDINILDTHIMMIQDPFFNEQVVKGIEERLMNVECIIEDTIELMIGSLKKTEDESLRERTVDLYDIQSRLLHQLLYIERTSLTDIAEEVVLVATNLLPSEVLTMNRKFIKGIALDGGGKTSHTAILARAFEIPAVLGLSSVSRKVSNGDKIIVDGNIGKVYIRPNRHAVDDYQSKLQRWERHEADLLSFNELSAKTVDGRIITLKANIEIPEEVDSCLSHGAEGIGLYRSEFLFMRPGESASEEEQFHAYAQVLKGMKGVGPVTIRTIDVGGDKVIPGLDDFDEENPILGWRAVRFCLARPDIFKTQLRAMFRASVYGKLRIMFPMISGVEELDHVLKIVQEVKRECRRDKITFDEGIKFGSMIEVPSAALVADFIARKVDFLSIGTNDLIQYTIAVDRGNDKIAYLYQPLHPGVLRLVQMVIEKGHQAGVTVGMCGEMAADPLYAVVLLGLGLDEFSMSPAGIPEVKRIIRSVKLSEAQQLVQKIITMDSYEKINRYVRNWMNERFELFNNEF